MIRRVLFLLWVSTFIYAEHLELDDLTNYRGVLKTPRLASYLWDETGANIIIAGSIKPGDALIKVDLVNQDTTSYLDSSAFLLDDGTNVFGSSVITSGVFTEDRSKLLFYSKKVQNWRRSYWADYYYLDLEKKKVFKVSKENSGLRNVKFSPDGNAIAYVRDDNNIYVYDINKKREKQLTKTGTDQILNGHLGWVYEEEFSLYDGYRWSPDSKYIAFYEEDQSEVPLFHMLDAVEGYPKVKSFKYPRAGEPNPKIRIGVVKANGGKTRWMDTQIPEDHYIPFLKWKGNDLVIMRMNRLQKDLVFLTADIKTGQTTEGITESDPEGWLELQNDYYFTNEGNMIWLSERSGFYHIFESSWDNSEHRQITSGNWEVISIEKVDTEKKKIWFKANKTSVSNDQLYSVSFDGTDMLLLTDNEGTHKTRISNDNEFFIDNWTSFNNPGQIDLISSDGKLVRNLGKTDLSQLEKYNWSIQKMISFPSADSSVTLNGILIYPVNYEKGKKYPLIVNGYGMPGSQIVKNSWSSTLNQFFAQEGFFVFKMDSRGMSGRGEDFKNLSYGNMARYLGPDQAAGVDHLISEGLVEKGRVGAWGWSGGGYFTSLLVTMFSSHYNVGVAVAPVTDFRFYDSIYTERYMGLPQDNKSGYDSTSVMSWVDRMNGHLMLMHGQMDDNVHAQNSTVLFDMGVEKGKDIDFYLYPGRNHGIYGRGSTQHLYRNLVNYFLENL